MSEWIKCSERLPDFETDVLVINEKGPFKKAVITAGLFSGFGDMSINGYSDVGWASFETEESIIGQVTHWQPMIELDYD